MFDWILSDKIRAAVDLVYNGGKLDEADARDIIKLLQKESATHIQKRVGKSFYKQYFPTDRHGSGWREGAPTGWVDHYTAGIKCSSTLRWFSKRDRGPGTTNSCAHFVMDHDGTVMVLVDPLTTVTWHATWANRTHIGIEHINAGRLAKGDNGEFLYQGRHLYPVKDDKPVQEISGKFWEPYTAAQLASNIALKRLIFLAIPTLKEDKFVDHQEIDPERKEDCGPLWPLHELNDFVFSWENAHKISVLEEKKVLVKEDVDRFKKEVRDLNAATTIHTS